MKSFNSHKLLLVPSKSLNSYKMFLTKSCPSSCDESEDREDG